MNNGIITDWNGMKELWRYIFEKLQKSPKEHPILLTEAPLNPFKNRLHMAEIFFEDFGAPKIFFQ